MTSRKTVPVADDASAFRHQVRMAAIQVAGLRPDELAAALAYEVEPVSGIPAAEAELAYTPVVDPDPTVRVYDVAVRRRSVRAASAGDRLVLPLAIAGAIAILAAGADFVFLRSRLASLKSDVEVQARLQATLDSIRSPARTARAETRAIRERRNAAEKAQSDAAAARTAYADILEAIAVACGNRAVLSSLEGGAGDIKLAATAVDADAATGVLVALTTAAEKQGWHLVPGPITVRGPGPTAEFKCEIVHD